MASPRSPHRPQTAASRCWWRPCPSRSRTWCRPWPKPSPSWAKSPAPPSAPCSTCTTPSMKRNRTPRWWTATSISSTTCTSTNWTAATAARAATILSRSSKSFSPAGTRAGFPSKPSISPRRRTPGQRKPAASRKPDRPTSIMSHYVVTGGAGFIGSAIVRKLLDEGARSIVVIDNLLTGRERNLEEIRSRIDFQRADIRNYEEIAPLFRGAAVVFHEAAIPSVPRSIDDPVPSHDVNANGTFTVLRAATEGQAGRVVYAASSSAYGDTDVLPKVESMAPRPKSPYALQKLMGEYYANIFSGVYGLETVSLRYFNVYGPRQDPSSAYSGVLSLFMTAVLERQAPTIFGDGEHSRDFTFVEDVADLNLKAARAKGASANAYNGGNGGSIKLNQAWALLQKLEGVTIAPVYAPPRAGDVRDSQADTTLAVDGRSGILQSHFG